MGDLRTLRDQYTLLPYPPVSRFALPRRDQGEALRFETGCRIANRPETPPKRVLVLGCGTLEPSVVAQANPCASEIVAIDFSATSMAILSQRYFLQKVTRFYSRIPKLSPVLMDLGQPNLLGFDLGKFDYILASNLLHHLKDPVVVLRWIKQSLEPNGLLRMVTYPKASRIWMRWVSRWLRLDPLQDNPQELIKKSRERISLLPKNHPARITFEIHPEIKTRSGLTDAFLNEWETPLRPLEWQSALDSCGFELLGEAQTESSQSLFLNEIIPPLKDLSQWEKLQILDDLLELCANPVFWIGHGPQAPRTLEFKPVRPVWQPVHQELQGNLQRVSEILKKTPITLNQVLKSFQTKVGPRVDPTDPGRTLQGLALSDYFAAEAAPEAGLASAVLDSETLGWVDEVWGDSAALGVAAEAPSLAPEAVDEFDTDFDL